MLQKILMVVVSLLSMLATSVVPGAWLGEDATPDAPAPVVDERITTLGYVPGKDYARISVIWIEMDGERVAEDAWGEGRIDTLRFKVGVKRAEGNAIELGDRTVPLSPTDVFTVRGFAGRYAFTDVGTSSATLALDGTVKNTLVSDGGGGGLATSGRGLPQRGAGERAPERLAYVTLDTGNTVGTLEVAPGGSKKIQTAGADALRTGASALDVRWVKLDDALVTSYTYGEGELPRVSFAPDTRFRSALNFSGTEMRFNDGDRVEIRDFIGSWSVTLRPGGGARLKLDGWSATADLLSGDAALNAAPSVAIAYQPTDPSTRDRVVFRADADDPDGSVVVHEWTFLRRLPEGLLQHTTEDLLTATDVGETVGHRFTRPGEWEVTLRVVDDQGAVAETTQTIFVANAGPTAAFDWFPDNPLTLERVNFYDRSTDLDGAVVSRLWDFGDGSTSTDREPTHAFGRDGVYNVTLTVRDATGATANWTNPVPVRNAAPECAFALEPATPTSSQQTFLMDLSKDRENGLRSWRWHVRDTETPTATPDTYTEQNPAHVFKTANVHEITLAVTDERGATSSCVGTVSVLNRLPQASILVTPATPKTGQAVVLDGSASTDSDGRIRAYDWSVNGQELPDGRVIETRFARAGFYTVNLTVLDDDDGEDTESVVVQVLNAPPVVAFSINPTGSQPTGTRLTFTDASVDPDGDPLRSWTWDFGVDEEPRMQSGRQVTHTFADDGTYFVNLTVEDEEGNSATLMRPVLVTNRKPVGEIRHGAAVATLDTAFQAVASDPDGFVERIQWDFGDGGTTEGRFVNHTFAEPGHYPVTMTLTDDDGSIVVVAVAGDTLEVVPLGPRAAFATDAPVGAADRALRFLDQSEARGAPIVAWDWNFGDGSARSSFQNPDHVYDNPSTYLVRLTVTDESGATGTLTQEVLVTQAPVARIALSRANVANGGSVTLTDASTDDGEIRSRAWKVDGADVSNAASFDHIFTGKGPHAVELTVVDDRDVSSTATATVTVDNGAPVADFVADGPVRNGIPATFRSTSTDPDGADDLDPTRGLWRVNGVPVAPTPEDPAVLVHTFEDAGTAFVEYVAVDQGGKSSSKQLQVRVAAWNPVQVEVLYRYEDGTKPPIGDITMTFTNRENGVEYSGTALVYDEQDASISLMLGPGEWFPGEAYRITTSSPGFGVKDYSIPDSAVTASPTDLGYALARVYIFPREFTPLVLDVEDGSLPGDLASLPRLTDGADPRPGWALYASTHERIRGTLAVGWQNPSAPAEGAFAQVWVNRSVTRDQRIPLMPDTCAASLCTHVSGFVRRDGTFPFDMPLMTEQLGLGNSMNPPGWYRLEAKVTWLTPEADSLVTDCGGGWRDEICPVAAARDVFVDAEGAVWRVFGATLVP